MSNLIQQIIDAKAKLNLKGVLARSPEAIDQMMFWLVKKAGFRNWLIQGPDGTPYLLRVYLLPERKPGSRRPNIFLHRFFRSDHDRFPHNHPWGTSFSVILTNGYTEERWDRQTLTRRFIRKGPLSINVIRDNDFHRVELEDATNGAWTLFVAFRKSQGWGFLDTDKDRFIPWRIFLGEDANGLEND